MAPWLLAAAYEAYDRLQHIWADMSPAGAMALMAER